jgi:hypothetical protein
VARHPAPPVAPPTVARRPAHTLARLAGVSAVLAVLTGALAGGLVAAPAYAQDDAPVRLTVTAFEGVLGPGSHRTIATEDLDAQEPPSAPVDLVVRAVVENLGATPLDSLRLVIEIYPAATSPAGLRAALDGRVGGSPLHVHDVPIGGVGRLAAGQAAGVGDRFTRETVAWAPDGGVHPVRLAVVRGTRVLTETTTAAVWLARPPAHPVGFGLIVPLREAPWRTSGGAYHTGVDRGTDVGGRLDRLLRAVERHPSAPIVLAPSAHLLEDLADRADGFTRLERADSGAVEAVEETAEGPLAARASEILEQVRAAAAELSMDPISGPYADADLTATLGGPPPLPDLAAQAATDGRRRLQRLLGRTIDTGATLLTDRIDPQVLDLLPSEVVVLPYAATVGPDAALDPDVSSPVATLHSPSGRRLLGVVADPHLATSLSEPDLSAGPLLAAQRVLVETAMTYFEAPGTSDRGLVALPVPAWRAEPRFLATLLDGLGQAAWLAPATPSELAVTVPPRPDPLELQPPGAPRFPLGLEAALVTAATDLEAARASLPADHRLIDEREPSELRDQLLRATSTWWRDGGDAEAESLTRDVARAIDTAFGDVEVLASGVTLTSHTGPVPITLHRSRGGPLLVQVEFVSQARLRFPEGRVSEPILLEPGATHTLSFTTEAVSTGSFPVTVRVTDPSGSRELARTVLSVRSTAISGPALTGLGLLVLVLLLIGALRTPRRPGPPPRLEVVRGTDAGSQSGPEARTVPTSDSSPSASERRS